MSLAGAFTNTEPSSPQIMKYALCDRNPGDGAQPLGISCDEDGVFIAGVRLVARSRDVGGSAVYKPRPAQELEKLLSNAYGSGIDYSAHIAGLTLIARYMTEGKWVLAKIAAVHLRLPDVPDGLALKKLLATKVESVSKHCLHCRKKRPDHSSKATRKRDVSNELRVPAGQSGGGEWTTEDGSKRPAANPLLIPAQAIAPPMPLPWGLELPYLPEEVTSFPFALPGAGLRPPPLVNPYPNKRKCVQEWDEAFSYCDEQERAGNFKPGYGGPGKDYDSCVLGQVSAECGGNPTA